MTVKVGDLPTTHCIFKLADILKRLLKIVRTSNIDKYIENKTRHQRIRGSFNYKSKRERFVRSNLKNFGNGPTVRKSKSFTSRPWLNCQENLEKSGKNIRGSLIPRSWVISTLRTGRSYWLITRTRWALRLVETTGRNWLNSYLVSRQLNQ